MPNGGAHVPVPVTSTLSSRPDRGSAAQAIERQPLDEILRSGRSQSIRVVAIGPPKNRKGICPVVQQSGPTQRARHILRSPALEETAHVFAGQSDDCAVGKGGRGHGA